ncbi:hypothetical protein SADUNF_Sadunf18G0117900 [Salix dunnii]|uniref:Endonuclease/exonuclease/phosphatase domain-containing protein n=1 Tax=Salix dunnii TaxID=1413687 RepID=A0A835MEB6_9ROSI|nr:hypothetical protein SADUNF_Sadunf18G0117900 [Salix dunnii]
MNGCLLTVQAARFMAILAKKLDQLFLRNLSWRRDQTQLSGLPPCQPNTNDTFNLDVPTKANPNPSLNTHQAGPAGVPSREQTNILNPKASKPNQTDPFDILAKITTSIPNPKNNLPLHPKHNAAPNLIPHLPFQGPSILNLNLATTSSTYHTTMNNPPLGSQVKGKEKIHPLTSTGESDEEIPIQSAQVLTDHMAENCPLSKMDSLGNHSISQDTTEDATSVIGTLAEAHDHSPSPSPKKKKKGGKKKKLRAVKSWINKCHLNMFGLLETKVSQNNLPLVESKLNLQGWKFLSNIFDENPCRIFVGWNSQYFNLSLVHSTAQWVTCEAVFLTTGETLVVTFVYGSNTPAGRKPLWDYIVNAGHLFSSRPWLILGDFNAVMQPEQRSGGDSRWHNYHEDFCMATHQAQITSLPFTDHSPMVAQLGIPPPGRHNQFKFLNLWANRDDFLPLVQAAWQMPARGNPMRRLLLKLKNVKIALKSFHKCNTSHITTRVTEAKIAWNAAQLALDRDPSNKDLLEVERRAAGFFASTSHDEEAMLKQKSRVQWLQLGDKNTGFFHKTILHRQTRNRINSLKDEEGNLTSNQQAMGKIAANYFENLLNNTHPPLPTLNLSFIY